MLSAAMGQSGDLFADEEGIDAEAGAEAMAVIDQLDRRGLAGNGGRVVTDAFSVASAPSSSARSSSWP